MKNILWFVLLVFLTAFAETLFQVKDSSDNVVLDVASDGLRIFNEGDTLMVISSGAIKAFIDHNSQKGLARSFSVTSSTNVKSGQANVMEVTTDATTMREGNAGERYTDFSPENMFLGLNAGSSINGGKYNVFIGNSAGNTTTGLEEPDMYYFGYYNTFIGFESGKDATNSYYNTYIGANSGKENTNGSDNTFVGTDTGAGNTGYGNTFVGSFSAGHSSGSGYANAFFGTGSGSYNTTGANNVFLGNSAGSSNQTGNDNVYVGLYAGGTNISGDGNVFLGRSAGANETGSNKLYIANNNTPTPLIYGDFTSGRIGLGTTSLSHRLEVADNVVGPMTRFKNSGNSYSRHGIRIDAGANTLEGDHWMIRCYTGDGSQLAGSIRSNNGTMSFVNSSDSRLKKNIKTSEFNALKILNGLRVVDYQWKTDEDNIKSAKGYIAQEAKVVLPDMVSTDPQTGYLGISTGYLIPVLHKAIQEQQEIIGELKNENAELKARIERIEKLLLKE